MSELLETLVSSEVKGDFVQWFVNFFKNTDRGCSLEEFSIFFLNFLRNQTDEFLKGNSSSSSCNTPRKVTAGGCPNGQSEPSSSSATATTATTTTPCAIAVTITPQNVTKTPKLLLSGNEHNTASGISLSDSLVENSLLDNSLQLRSSTPTNSRRKETPHLRKSLSKTFESVHEPSIIEDGQSSNFDSPSQKNFDSRSYRSNTSTPVRKSNKSSFDGSSFGSGSKNKSLDKSGTKKSPGTALCLGDFMVTPARQKRRPHKVQPGVENRSSSEPGGKSPSIKPKRRVVPTLVSSTTNSFTSPAFRSENNILGIAKEELPIEEHSNIIVERQVLKSQMTAIAKEFTNEPPFPQTLHKIIQENMTPKKIAPRNPIDITNLPNRNILDRFIAIHTVLIDMNLTINFLNEISFLLNLINIEEEFRTEWPALQEIDLADPQIDPRLINRTNPTNTLYTVLKNLNNCTYFALGVLRNQKHNLALLDVTTLKVILDNDRLETYDADLRNFLDAICTQKIHLESIKSSHEVSFRIRQDFNNVFYQQENDTRNNFPSEKEFTAFKQQRDMFYGILKIWECKHVDPSWKFSIVLGPKICALLAFQENPINMAHLAKLFISQLIISSHFTHSPNELEIALPNIDLNKLTKLRQRLVAPSHFSTDYQFPGNQVFFRDFLLVCRKSLLFVNQLKIALTAELIEMNNSSYEIVNLSSTDASGREYNEYVVRPETISTMRILSKFLGLVVTLPYTYDGVRNSLVDNRQIELRNKLQPSFDLMDILRKSITERKLIITIPWLVQYISMLDFVTLRLIYYRRVIQLLFELYMSLTTIGQHTSNIELLQIRPTSIFIIRSSLGWLFDNPNIPEDYYKYRQNRRFDFTNGDVKEMSIADVSSSNDGHDAMLSTIPNPNPSIVPIYDSEKIRDAEFDSLLENILNVACPFLADFRVSIMPAKFSKSLSRTGRYRYITTKISETCSHEQENDAQIKLSEAFLHSQSLSVRKIVEFVIERTTSAVIKDFQMEILIPSKAEAVDLVGKISLIELKDVSNEMIEIFSKTHKEAMQKWDRIIPTMIEARVKKALDALLPNETLDVIKRTCMALVIQKCKAKTEDWRLSNLCGLEFYSKDITADAEKFRKVIAAGKQQVSTVLEIDIDKPWPSKVFERLQIILHFTITQHALLNQEDMMKFCKDFHECLTMQTLPTSMYRLAGIMTLNLVQNLIQHRCDILSDVLIEQLINIWLCDGLKEFVNLSKNDDAEESKNLGYIFSSLLPIFYIRLLGNNVKAFECLTHLIVALINANLVTIDYLNELFVGLLQAEWSCDVHRIISDMLDNIGRKTVNQNTNNDEKSQLFMEMLADLTRDLDEF